MSDSRQKTGHWGETVAASFLKKSGFEILQRNYRAERGEIDIIARKAGTIVFVEVKAGKVSDYGLPEERVTPAKQRQLYKVAGCFIEAHPELPDNFRFDVIVVEGSPERYQIRHYQNAFYLMG